MERTRRSSNCSAASRCWMKNVRSAPTPAPRRPKKPKSRWKKPKRRRPMKRPWKRSRKKKKSSCQRSKTERGHLARAFLLRGPKGSHRLRVLLVPFRNSRHISRRQHVVVDHVERKSAVDIELVAFVFVVGNVWGKMRDHVPDIHDTVADVDVGVIKGDEIVVADARLGPSVHDRGKILSRV